jgi:hypothetical protein
MDLTNPAQPTLHKSVNLVGRELQVLLQDDYALVWKSSVFDSLHYLDILNVADPEASPKTVSTVRFSEAPKSLACGEGCLYALGASGLQVLDLSDPNGRPSWALKKPVDLSSSLLTAKMEKDDHPILDSPPSDTEVTTPVPWEFLPSGWIPWCPWSLFSSAFSPVSSSTSKGYGPVAMPDSSLYDFSGAFGPWLGSGPLSYSGSGSCAYARGAVTLLNNDGGNSSSSDYGYSNLPFFSFWF